MSSQGRQIRTLRRLFLLGWTHRSLRNVRERGSLPRRGCERARAVRVHGSRSMADRKLNSPDLFVSVVWNINVATVFKLVLRCSGASSIQGGRSSYISEFQGCALHTTSPSAVRPPLSLPPFHSQTAQRWRIDQQRLSIERQCSTATRLVSQCSLGVPFTNLLTTNQCGAEMRPLMVRLTLSKHFPLLS